MHGSFRIRNKLLHPVDHRRRGGRPSLPSSGTCPHPKASARTAANLTGLRKLEAGAYPLASRHCTHRGRHCGIVRTRRGCVPGASAATHTPGPTLRNRASSGRVCCASGAAVAGTPGCVTQRWLNELWLGHPTCDHVLSNQARAYHTRGILALREAHPRLRGTGPLFAQRTRGELAGSCELGPGVCGGGYSSATTLQDLAN